MIWERLIKLEKEIIEVLDKHLTEYKVVNFPLEPKKFMTLLSFLSGCPNFLRTNLILFKSKLIVLLKSL